MAKADDVCLWLGRDLEVRGVPEKTSKPASQVECHRDMVGKAVGPVLRQAGVQLERHHSLGALERPEATIPPRVLALLGVEPDVALVLMEGLVRGSAPAEDYGSHQGRHVEHLVGVDDHGVRAPDAGHQVAIFG